MGKIQTYTFCVGITLGGRAVDGRDGIYLLHRDEIREVAMLVAVGVVYISG
jgi:hypothetical protein